MIKKVFAVYDVAIKAYSQPFYERSTDSALRGWEQACNDSRTEMNKTPSDYCLFELGEFDDDTGRFTNLHAPVSLGLAQQFIRSTNKVSTPALAVAE